MISTIQFEQIIYIPDKHIIIVDIFIYEYQPRSISWLNSLVYTNNENE